MAALVRSATEAIRDREHKQQKKTEIREQLPLEYCVFPQTQEQTQVLRFHEIPPASKWTCEVNIPDKFQSMNEAAHTLIPSNFSQFPVEILVCECVQVYVQLIL